MNYDLFFFNKQNERRLKHDCKSLQLIPVVMFRHIKKILLFNDLNWDHIFPSLNHM